MRPARALAAAAVAAGLGLAGCTGTPAEGSGAPTQTVESFMHALGDKDPDTACAQVSTGGEPLSGLDLDQCREGLRKVLAAVQDPSDLARLKSAKVTGAQVTGDKATVLAAQITGVPDGYQNDIDLLRLGGRWYIDSKTPAG